MTDYWKPYLELKPGDPCEWYGTVEKVTERPDAVIVDFLQSDGGHGNLLVWKEPCKGHAGMTLTHNLMMTQKVVCSAREVVQ